MGSCYRDKPLCRQFLFFGGGVTSSCGAVIFGLRKRGEKAEKISCGREGDPFPFRAQTGGISPPAITFRSAMLLSLIPHGKRQGRRHHGADTRELLKLPGLPGWEIIWSIKDRRRRIVDGSKRVARALRAWRRDRGAGVNLIPEFRYDKRGAQRNESPVSLAKFVLSTRSVSRDCGCKFKGLRTPRVNVGNFFLRNYFLISKSLYAS